MSPNDNVGPRVALATRDFLSRVSSMRCLNLELLPPDWRRWRIQDWDLIVTYGGNAIKYCGNGPPGLFWGTQWRCNGEATDIEWGCSGDVMRMVFNTEHENQAGI